ncbi:hypothetical protein PGT21_028042 [Puccinia graminis f. sp. tritici]|uniref:Uncharacterized protein n=1 Tax=Puccinia graminis f. sp. tritici TaxID=56615 RepID=A0A5B0M1A4_PUCGR|nr:hypothetical protein PGT21_028042 [Puccinia graminis f. sp. tritici]
MVDWNCAESMAKNPSQGRAFGDVGRPRYIRNFVEDLGIFCVQPDFFLIAGDSVKSCSMLAYRWTVYKILVQSRKI